MPVTSSSLMKQMKDGYAKRNNRDMSFEEYMRSNEVLLQKEYELPEYLFDANVLSLARELGENACFYEKRHAAWMEDDRECGYVFNPPPVKK